MRDVQFALPSEDQILRAKQELNFLLWTKDAPSVPPELISTSGCTEEYGGPNIQCIAHTVITSGLLMRRGLRVTTRAGKAFLVELSPDGNQRNDRLERIDKHWWASLDDHGLVDLSLRGENEHPLFFCNRNPGNRWHLGFSVNEVKVNGFLKTRRQGCFYVTIKKHNPTTAEMTQSLEKEFPPATKEEILYHIRKY